MTDGSWTTGAVDAANEVSVDIFGPIESLVALSRISATFIIRLCDSTLRTDWSVVLRRDSASAQLIQIYRILRSVQIDSWNATTDR